MLRRAVLLLVLLLATAGAALTWIWHRQPPGMEAYRSHLHETPAPDSATLTATWLGVTAVLLRQGPHALLIDPFFTRPPGLVPLLLNRRIAPDETRVRLGLAEAGIDRLDAVLVSHSHYDHAMDAGVVARLSGALLVGSESTANIGRGAGLPEAQLHVVQSAAPLQFGPFSVRFVPSRHAGRTGGAPTGDITQPLAEGARYLDYRQGGTWSILVGHAQGTVLLHGSAGFEPGALQGVRADLVFLGIALVDDLPEYLRQTVDAVGARRIVPTHWDDFTRPLQWKLRPFPLVVRLDQFFEHLAQRPELQVQTLQPGVAVALFPR